VEEIVAGGLRIDRVARAKAMRSRARAANVGPR